MMSMRTTSASSLDAIQWAAVAPTFPEPTMVTFLRMNESFLEILDPFNTAGTGTHRVKPRGRKMIYPVPLQVERLSCLGENRRSHVFNDAVRKLAGSYFGGAFHQAFEIIGDFLLQDGALHSVLDEIGGFVPSQKTKHHYAREHHRARIDDVFVGILWRRAVRGFEDSVSIADVRTGCDAETADLRGASVRNIIAVQIRRGQYGILIGTRDHLLEN